MCCKREKNIPINCWLSRFKRKLEFNCRLFGKAFQRKRTNKKTKEDDGWRSRSRTIRENKINGRESINRHVKNISTRL